MYTEGVTENTGEHWRKKCGYSSQQRKSTHIIRVTENYNLITCSLCYCMEYNGGN